MRYAPGHKERTRAKILEAAGRVFRRRGYQGAGIDEVMEEAGLTAGGFYSHFGSKEALLGETFTHLAAEMENQRHPRLGGLTGREWLMTYVGRYLSPGHRDNLEGGCPMAALVSEVSRSGEPVKERFEAAIRDLAAESGDGIADDRTLAIVALCVGGLGLARSVRDEALGDRILAACRALADRGIGSGEARARDGDDHVEATTGQARGRPAK